MASRSPVLVTEALSREDSWYNWLDHLESMAEVNKWDVACIKGLQERFKLESQKKLYLTRCLTRGKQTIKHWAELPKIQMYLSEKPSRKLQADTKEQLALSSDDADTSQKWSTVIDLSLHEPLHAQLISLNLGQILSERRVM